MGNVGGMEPDSASLELNSRSVIIRCIISIKEGPLGFDLFLSQDAVIPVGLSQGYEIYYDAVFLCCCCVSD